MCFIQTFQNMCYSDNWYLLDRYAINENACIKIVVVLPELLFFLSELFIRSVLIHIYLYISWCKHPKILLVWSRCVNKCKWNYFCLQLDVRHVVGALVSWCMSSSAAFRRFSMTASTRHAQTLSVAISVFHTSIFPASLAMQKTSFPCC